MDGQLSLDIDNNKKKISIREEKRRQKEKIELTIQTLSMIFDKVQKSKNHDRYIVSDGTNWGVVDSTGTPIIPLKFTRITTSNDRVFRVYGEISIIPATNIWDINPTFAKYQGITDYDGNMLLALSPYNKILSIEKRGLLFGYSMPIDEILGVDTNIAYVDYDKGAFIFPEKIVKVYMAGYIPELILGLSEDKTAYGLRVDKELKLLDIKDAYDSIEKVKVDEESVKNLTATSYVKQLTSDDEVIKSIFGHNYIDGNTYYIGKINGREILLTSNYTPILPDIKGQKYKPLYK